VGVDLKDDKKIVGGLAKEERSRRVEDLLGILNRGTMRNSIIFPRLKQRSTHHTNRASTKGTHNSTRATPYSEEGEYHKEEDQFQENRKGENFEDSLFS